MPFEAATLRIMDASLNRASEGLRVVEDFTRFVLDDAHLSTALKQLRHDLAAASGDLSQSARSDFRDTPGDVGVEISTDAEAQRTSLSSVCVANLQRAKQSLRSLEEYAKLSRPELGRRFESLRYRLYSIEAAVQRTTDARERLGNVRLYLLVSGCDSPDSFERLIHQVVGAGVDAIQLRDKRLCDAELLNRARSLVHISRARALAANPQGPTADAANRRTLAIINDRADIAVAADADGVHLGQDDLPAAAARRILGAEKLIGVSTHCIEQARAAVLAGANYLGAGPTFPSQTKSFASFPGLAFLKKIAEEISLPTFAIGGISTHNVGQVSEVGIRRIAVGDAVVSANDPAASIHALRTAMG